MHGIVPLKIALLLQLNSLSVIFNFEGCLTPLLVSECDWDWTISNACILLGSQVHIRGRWKHGHYIFEKVYMLCNNARAPTLLPIYMARDIIHIICKVIFFSFIINFNLPNVGTRW